jgi:hypothetical protein
VWVGCSCLVSRLLALCHTTILPPPFHQHPPPQVVYATVPVQSLHTGMAAPKAEGRKSVTVWTQWDHGHGHVRDLLKCSRLLHYHCHWGRVSCLWQAVTLHTDLGDVKLELFCDQVGLYTNHQLPLHPPMTFPPSPLPPLSLSLSLLGSCLIMPAASFGLGATSTRLLQEWVCDCCRVLLGITHETVER